MGLSFVRAAQVFGTSAFALAATAFAGTAHAASDPRGIWYDHDGRGAVEIKECSGNSERLCGHVVYVKLEKNKKRCGMQIIGNLRGNGRGWIYSPSRGRSYPLAAKRLSDDRLRIIGNAGSFFTKTYVWKRAPDTIANCNQPAVVETKQETPKIKAVKVQKTAAEKTVAPVKTKDAVKTPEPQPTLQFSDASSGSTALLLASTARAEEPRQPKPVTSKQISSVQTDDLTPPGGLSDGNDDKLEKLDKVIKKFTGGKGLKSLKVSGNNGKKCKYRIPYVGRTINVPCK